jgi:hypothetical protein
VPLNLAADRAFVAKLDLFKFVPVRLNRLAAEISADPELAQSVAIIEYLDETLRSRC